MNDIIRRSRLHAALPVCLVSLSTLAGAPRASALFGVGDVVLDPSNLAQAVIQVTQQGVQIANEATIIANQYSELNNQYQQLVNESQLIYNQVLSLQDLSFDSWTDTLNSLDVIRSQWAVAVTRVEWRAASLEAWWDGVYDRDRSQFIDAPTLNTLLGKRANLLDDAYDTAKGMARTASAQVEEVVSRASRVADIGAASQQAVGEKSAIQANTQMAGQVFAELQAIHVSMLASTRHQTTLQMQDLEEQDIAEGLRSAFNAGGAGADAPSTGVVVTPR